MIQQKVIDITSNLEMINNYNSTGTSSNSRITASASGNLVMYSTNTSSNSSSGALVLLNGGVSINTTIPATSVTNGGGITIRGGASILQNTIIGGGLSSYFNSNTLGNLYTTGGNIGINTASPLYHLDVNGTGRFNNLIIQSTGGNYNPGSIFSDSNWGMLFRSATQTPADGAFSFADYNDNKFLTIASTGNVGIGTSTPVFTLDVSGTGRFTTGLTTSTLLATTSISSGSILGTNSTITNAVHTNLTSGTLNLSTGLTTATLLATSSISSGSIHGTNSTITNAVHTNLSSGTLNLSTGLTTGTLLATNISTATLSATNVILTNLTTSNSITAIGNSNTIGNIFTTSGNVGINTPTPSYILDILGDFRTNSGINMSIFQASSASDVLQIQNLNTNGSSSIEFLNTAGNAKLTIGFGNNGTSIPIFAGSGFVYTENSIPLKLSAGLTVNPVVISATDNSISINSTTTTTNQYSGALKVAGDAGIVGSLFIGGSQKIYGDLEVSGSIQGAAASSSTFAYLTLTATDEAINETTGSLITFGGITIQSSTNATDASNGGGLLVLGGAAIGKSLIVGGVISSGNANLTNITTGIINIGNLTGTSLSVGNISSINATSVNLLVTNISSGTIRATTLITTSNLSSGYITTGNLSVGSITGGNIDISGNMNIAGTLNVVNITTTNLTNTNITASIALITNLTANIASITTNLAATGNSNTIGNIYTTGGNVGINTISPAFTLDVSGTGRFTSGITTGTLLATTNIYSSSLNATNLTVTNAVSTNISAATLNLSTGLTTETLLATTSISSGVLNATNSTITNAVFTNSSITNLVLSNASSASLNLSTGLTTGTILATTSISTGALNATNSTITNIVLSNASAATLNLSTGLTTSTLLATTSISAVSILATNQTVINTIINTISSGNIYSNGLRVNSNVETWFYSGTGGTYIYINPIATSTAGGYGRIGAYQFGGPSQPLVLQPAGNNVGIGTTSPSFTLDVSGTGRFTTGLTTATLLATTSISTSSLNSTNSTITNVVITSSSITNSVLTNASAATLNLSTGLTTGTLLATTTISTSSLNSTNSTITNAVITSSSITNIVLTNASAATLNLSTGLTTGTLLASTSISTGILNASNITTINLVGTNASATSLNLSTGLTTATLLATTSISTGLLNASNATIDTLQSSNLTTGNINITGAIYQNGAPYIASQWTSGTGGNLFYTNGNVGFGTTAPSFTLDVSGTGRFTTGITTGTLLATTNISTSSLNSTNSTITNAAITSSSITNIVLTNASAATLNLSTGITTSSLLATTSISSGLLNASNSTITNAVLTNASTATLNLSTGLTTATLLATTSISTGLLNATNSTFTNVVITSSSMTNIVLSNASAATLNLSTGLTTATLLATISISTSSLNSTNSTITNAVITSSSITNAVLSNASAATLNLSTGLTTGTLLATTSISTGLLNAINSTITNTVITSSSITNAVLSNVSAATLNLSTGLTTATLLATTSVSTGLLNATNATINTLQSSNLTTGNINITGSIYQNGAPYIASQWTSGTGGNLFYTNGNVGFGTTAPSFTLDVSGTGRFTAGITTSTLLATTSISTGLLNSTNSTITNAVITSSSITNAVLSNASAATLNLSTGLTTGTLLATTSISTGLLNSTNSTVTNSVITSSSITNSVLTNASAATLNLSTGLTTGTLLATTSISTGILHVINANITNLTTSNMITNNLINGIASSFSGSFIASNNTNTPTNVTGFNFLSSNIRSFQAQITVSITRNTGGNLFELITMDGNQTDAGWTIYTTNMGDTSGVTFSITSNGQIQYTSTNITNFTASTIRFSVTQISNNGTYTYVANLTTGPIIIDSLQLTTTSGIALVTPSINSYGNSNTIGNIFTTGGNVGIGTSAPSFTLDVTGTARFTSGLTTATLLATTNISTGILNATNSTITNTVITSSSITNIILSNATAATLNLSTGLTTGTLLATTSISTGLLNATNSTITNVVITNASASTLNLSTGLTTGTLFATNISTGNITAGTINLSGNMNIAGTLSVVNITTTNLLDTNITAGIALVTTNLNASGNSNTLGNIFTTGGNVGIGTKTPSYILDVTGGSTRISSTSNPGLIINSPSVGANGFSHPIQAFNVNQGANETYAFNLGQGNATYNVGYYAYCYVGSGSANNYLTMGLYSVDKVLNINGNRNVGINTTAPSFTLDVSGTARFTTGLTTGTLLATTSVSTGLLNVTNSTITNVVITSSSITNSVLTNASAATLNLSTGLTTGTLLATTSISTGLLNATNSTISNIFITSSSITNAVLTNASAATLNLSTGLTTGTLLATTSISSASIQGTNSTITNAVHTALSTGTAVLSGSSGSLILGSDTGAITSLTSTQLYIVGNRTSSINVAGIGFQRSNNRISSMGIDTTNNMSFALENSGDSFVFKNASNDFNRTTSGTTLLTILSSGGISTGVLNASNATTTNFVGTNVSSSTLNLSTGLTTGTLLVTTNISTGLLNATNSTISNVVITSSSITNSVLTNASAATLNLSTGLTTATILATTSISSGNISVTNISVGNLSGGSINLSGNMNIAGTLSVINITTTNLMDTNITAGIALVTTNLNASGNSNTIGSIFTTGGNVGIGTSAPIHALHVGGGNSIMLSTNGSVWITGNADTSPLKLRMHNAGAAGSYFDFAGGPMWWRSGTSPNSVMSLQTSGNLNVTNLTSTGNSNTLGNIFTTGGNVGIGTVSPAEALTVTGNLQINNTAGNGGGSITTTNEGSSNNKLVINGSRGGGGIVFQTNNGGSTGARMIITANGLVGIGTSSPSYTLDVSGNQRVQSNTNGGGNVLLISNSHTGGSAYSIVQIGNDTVNNLSLLLNSSTRSSDGGVNTATIRNDAGALRLANTGTNAYIMITGGNVGINTSTPSYTLDVSGTQRVGVYDATNGRLQITGDYSSGVYLQIAKMGVVSWGSATNYDNTRYIQATGSAENTKDFNVGPGGVGIGYPPPNYSRSGADGLYVSGNVGIGTTSPTAILSVVGAGGGGSIRIAPTSVNSESSIGFYSNSGFTGGSSNGDYWVIGQGSWSAGTRNLGLGGNGVGLVMTLSSQGNVGIGTANPTFALDVSGTGRFTSNVLCNANGSGFRHSTGSCIIETWNDGNSAWFQTATNHPLNFGVGNNANAVYTINTNGNIGINTSSPNSTTKLQIAGNVIITGDGTTTDKSGALDVKMPAANVAISSGSLMKEFAQTITCNTATNGSLGIAFGISNGIDITPGAAILHERVGGNSLGLLHFATKSGTGITSATLIRMTIQTSGNVGIGTTAPGSTLTVNGSLSKNSGTFDIKHPLPTKESEDYRLIHSFIEGPRCDLIYRGTIKLTNGNATVNLDKDCVAEAGCEMTEGTFEALCTNPQVFANCNTAFEHIIGNITGGTLIIQSNNTSSNVKVDWMVIAERKDKYIKEWNRTNTNGYLITEYKN